MNLLATKMVAMLLICAIILFFILLPIKLCAFIERKGRKGKLFLSACNCFGGGVLLGLYLLHMGPEVREMLEDSLLTPRDIDYPVPEVITGAGFFAILFFEWFIHYLQRRPTQKNDIAKEEGKLTSVKTALEEETSPVITSGSAMLSILPFEGDTSSVGTLETTTTKAELLASKVRSVIMMVALSLDNVFEGMALGLSSTNADVWNLFIAIVGHEFIVALCIGLELVRNQKRTRVVVVSGVFFSLTPAVGVAIGVAIFQKTEAGGDTLVNGILLAIATGVFLYCTFIGILSEELNDRSKLFNLVMVLLGFLLMVGMGFIPE